MQLRLALKPLKPSIAPAAKATVPNRASSCYGLRPLLLRPRISNSSAPPLPAPGSARGTRRCSCPPEPRMKARDDEAGQQAPAAKQGEDDEEAAAERRAAPGPGERSMAYQIFAGLYVCAYVFFWRTSELITLNAQDALERLRRYVRDNFFNQKR